MGLIAVCCLEWFTSRVQLEIFYTLRVGEGEEGRERERICICTYVNEWMREWEEEKKDHREYIDI